MMFVLIATTLLHMALGQSFTEALYASSKMLLMLLVWILVLAALGSMGLIPLSVLTLIVIFKEIAQP